MTTPPFQPQPCPPGCAEPTEPVAPVGLCLPDGTPIAVTVTRDCDGVTVAEGWVNLTTGTYTPGAPPAGTAACDPPCTSPTEPLATTGLCLADGSPIAVVTVRDCSGAVTSSGWINLLTGVYSAGAPPVGTIACGESRSIQVSGTFCDIDAGGNVVGLVLVEYHYDDAGAIESVRLVDAVTGATYTPTPGGTITVCPAPVEQPEQDLVQLCYTAPDGTVTRIIRDYRRDENGIIVGRSDYTLDGVALDTSGGVVDVCATCQTTPVCVRPSGRVEFISNRENLVDGSVDGDWEWATSLAGPWFPMYRVGVYPGWTTVDGGTPEGVAHWVAPHPNSGAFNTGRPGEGPTVPADWYARATFALPPDADPATIKIGSTAFNADQLAVEWRLNGGTWQAVNRAHNQAPYVKTPAAVPGAQAGNNEVILHVRETVLNQPAAGLLVHMIAEYDVDPSSYVMWSRVSCDDGTAYYVDDAGVRQDDLPAGWSTVPCGGSCLDCETTLLCDVTTEGPPPPIAITHTSFTFTGSVVQVNSPANALRFSGGGVTPNGVATRQFSGLIPGATYNLAYDAGWYGTGVGPSGVSDARYLLEALDDTGTVIQTTPIVNVTNGATSPQNGPFVAQPVFSFTAPASGVASIRFRDQTTLNGYNRDLGIRANTLSTTVTGPAQMVPFLRRICVDCNGEFVSKTDTRLDGETIYDPTGTVGACAGGADSGGGSVTDVPLLLGTVCYDAGGGVIRTAAVVRCAGCSDTTLTYVDVETGDEVDAPVVVPCPPAAAADVETWPLCLIDVDGSVFQRLRAEQVYDASGAAVGAPRLVDAVTGAPVLTIPGGITIGACCEPTRETVCVVPLAPSSTRVVSNPGNNVTGRVDPAWTWGLTPAGGNPVYDVDNLGGLWSTPLPAAGGWVSLNPDHSTTGLPNGPGDYYMVTSFTLPPDAKLDATSLKIDTLNADNHVVSYSLNGGPETPVPAAGTSHVTSPYTEPDHPIAGAVAGTNLLAIRIHEDSAPSAGGVLLDVTLTYRVAGAPEYWIAEHGCDGTTTYIDPDGNRYPGGLPDTAAACVGGGSGRGGVVSVLEACRCDDTDADGIGDVDYVELLGVAADGTMTSLGTYTPDLSAPYDPVAPVECPAEGAEPAAAVQARRVVLTAGQTWDAATWPLLQSVTALAVVGTATVTDAAGPSTLYTGESATWSVARPDDSVLRGPLTITADAGATVTVSFTVAVTA